MLHFAILCQQAVISLKNIFWTICSGFFSYLNADHLWEQIDVLNLSLNMALEINLLRRNGCNNSSRTRIGHSELLDPLSYWGSYKITFVCLFACPSVRQFGIFLRNGLLVIADLCTIVDNWNIWKLMEPFFPGKFIFAQIWAKRVQNGPKLKCFGFFEKFCL